MFTAGSRRSRFCLRGCAAYGILALLVAGASPVLAHPAPFSYIDLRVEDGRIDGALVAHAIDLAHELGLAPPDRLLEPGAVAVRFDRLAALLASRLALDLDGRIVRPRVRGFEVLADRQAVRFGLRFDVPGPPGRLGVRAALFPYDPNHQTFVNVYEHGTLTHQSILDRRLTAIDCFTGTRQGTVAVVRKFVPAGVHHILIGPDHVLFLIGLLLLGGRMLQLVKIVTAFTLAHSVTLSLAALDLVNPSARLVEPSIALSIAYVGADNLLVSRDGRDVRAWIAFGFGLVHGFGFASVLKALDLPRRALGWSLFSFNVGVEIGQVLIVIIIAGALAWVARTKPALSRPIAVAGSVVVAAAGVYWFVERVFLTGGPS